jgi:hypothetical protein
MIATYFKQLNGVFCWSRWAASERARARDAEQIQTVSFTELKFSYANAQNENRNGQYNQLICWGNLEHTE